MDFIYCVGKSYRAIAHKCQILFRGVILLQSCMVTGELANS